MNFQKSRILLTLLIFFLGGSFLLYSYAQDQYRSLEKDREEIKSYIESELDRPTSIVLTAVRKNKNNTITITGTITNMGKNTLTNLEVNGMLIKDEGEVGSHYQALNIFEEDKISLSQLQPDTSVNYTFVVSDLKWNLNSLDVVIFVQSPESPNKEIHQAIYLD